METPTRRVILFVCTGNTCRSPLAEALCRMRLAEKFACTPAELSDKGFEIGSAGVLASPEEAASRQAVDVGRECGVELESHRSRAVNPELLARATEVYGLTRSHADTLALRFPNIGPAPLVLGEHEDVSDPIGGTVDDYRACARMIQHHVDRLLQRWLGS